MTNKILEKLIDSPIIPAVKNEEALDQAIKTDAEIIFILTSNIFNLKDMVESIKSAGKMAFAHFDLIDGLSSSSISLEYLSKETKIDGIISTKNNIIRLASKMNLLRIQRFFILDSLSLKNLAKNIKDNKPDAIEILPGLMPKIIKRISGAIDIPLIAGGLIEDREDILKALQADGSGISTTNRELWNM